MARESLDQLEARCQKPDYRTVGNWMARRVTRPLALRVTWLVLPWGISPHLATLAAWAMGVAAAATFGQGSPAAWLLGAGLLQLWYLLDHVDGQLARHRGVDSLDGAQLDYLMHHTVNLLLPVGLGWGLAWRRLEPLWLLAGLAMGLALLLLGLRHDARYKAFVKRWKRVRGRLLVEGGGGGRPGPTPPVPRRPLALAAWCARKACETHVVMNLLTLLAFVQWIGGDEHLVAGRAYLAVMAPLATALALVVILRDVGRGAAEREFADWHRPEDDCVLTYQGGWWRVEPIEQAGDGSDSTPETSRASRPS